jgi:hypothetical protein
VAASSKVYGLALLSLASGQINFTGSTVKAILLTSSYTPNQDTHRYKSDLSGEAVGTGYTAGGQAVTGKTVTYSATSNTATWACDSPAWPTTTVSARYLAFYVDTGTSTTSPLISYVDFGLDVTSTGGTWTYPVPAAGIAQFVAA